MKNYLFKQIDEENICDFVPFKTTVKINTVCISLKNDFANNTKIYIFLKCETDICIFILEKTNCTFAWLDGISI